MEVSKEVCDLHTKHYETLLSQHEETIRHLSECTQKLTHIVDTQTSAQRELNKRLERLELRPSSILEKVFVAFITALASIVVTILFYGG